MLKILPLLILSFTLVGLTPCWALQSGSRGAAPSGGGSGSRSFSPPVSTPSQSSPSQSFSAPQNFSAPVQGFPSASPSSPSQNFAVPTELGQPIGSVVDPAFQYQNQYQTQGALPSTQSTSSESSSFGIPDAGLVDPVFEINNPGSPYVIDHSNWDYFLSRYVVTDNQGLNRVRYGRVTREDRQVLECYLNQLQSTDVRTLNRNEQLAFWCNLYNARTVDIVLDNYPIRSIRQVKMKFTDFVGPFDDPGAVTVLGKSLSLNDIESGIVRPVWKDPRIHYALNCASYGCPNLAPQAWTAADLDGRLNGAAYEYINSDRAIRSGVFGVKVSKIFKWYKDDFGGSDQAVLNHLRQYANPSTQQKLQGRQSIRGHFYDWSLNDGRITRRRLLERVIR